MVQEKIFYLIFLDKTSYTEEYDNLENKPIFYDADILICFLSIRRVDILKKLFSKVIIPSPVYYELINIDKYDKLDDMLNDLINENFVEIGELEFASPEETTFNLIHRGYWTDGNIIGKGEAAAMAFAIENNGIVASNNLIDIIDICEDYEIPIITASMILAFCLELKLMSKNEIESVWQKILKNTKQKLPKQTFNEYYEMLFKKDCVELLRNYNFKKHYLYSKKRKKAKI